MEVTLRTDAAPESIRRIAQKFPEVLLGAGTVITFEQAQVAWQAGAQFLVSPGLDERVLIWVKQKDLPFLPSAVTPTEIMLGLNLGLNLLKFSPAEVLGDSKAINAISDPFPDVRFIPAGGVKAENLANIFGLKRSMQSAAHGLPNDK